jgi:hypothetical protein
MIGVERGSRAAGIRGVYCFGVLVFLAMNVDSGFALEISQSPVKKLVGRAFVLRNRSVGDALALIYPLLSDRGTVFVEAGESILTVQDREEVLDQLAKVIAEMDRPAGRVDLEFQIVNAALGKSKGSPSSGLPADLVVRLSQLLRYRSFRLLAERKIAVEDREEVQLNMGVNYHLGFRLQGESPEERIRLEGFQLDKISETTEARPLIHTHLDLRLGKPMILGLAKTESSPEALVVVINYQESAHE